MKYKTAYRKGVEKILAQMERDEAEANSQMRLLPKMEAADKSRSQIERGFVNEDELKGDREEAFASAQHYRVREIL